MLEGVVIRNNCLWRGIQHKWHNFTRKEYSFLLAKTIYKIWQIRFEIPEIIEDQNTFLKIRWMQLPFVNVDIGECHSLYGSMEDHYWAMVCKKGM